MTRFLRFLVRNWPLKVAAIVLATVLYSGLVLSQNARIWPDPVPIRVLNQPENAFLLDQQLPDVRLIRYLAPTDLASRLVGNDFRAVVDLAGLQPQPGGAPVRVTVEVTALNPRVQVLSWEPQSIDVRLDPVAERVVPVTVDRGAVPAGLVAADPEVEPSTVTVRAPGSILRQVESAVARVTIDPSAINVDTTVPVFAVDELGQPIQPVDIDPEEVHVRIQVGRAEETRPVPVVPRFEGSLPVGYEVARVEQDPLIVTLSGEFGTLAGIDSVATEPIDLTARRTDLVVMAELDLPEGVTAVDTSTVEVRVTIEPQRGSRSFGIGLALDGARADLAYRVSLPSVLVTFTGEVSDIDRVDPTRLMARVDVTGLGPGTHRLPVTITPPTRLRLGDLTPETVAVTISGPTSTTPTSPPEG